MSKLSTLANDVASDIAPDEISPLASKYFDMVAGGCPPGHTPSGFREYYQNSGDTGGPASPGGAFWQQVVICDRVAISIT